MLAAKTLLSNTLVVRKSMIDRHWVLELDLDARPNINNDLMRESFE